MMGLGKLINITVLVIWKISTLYTTTGVTVVILLNTPKSLAVTPSPPLISNSSLAVITNSSSSSLKDGDRKNLHCIDLADFFYDIILALSSFPTAMCNHKEEKEISHFLTQKINQIVQNTPGTLQTKNKICNKAINSRRILIHQEKYKDQLDEKYSQLFPSEPIDHHRKLLLHGGRRSFIYIGGGRCRFCFYDNVDVRQRQLALLFNHNEKNNDKQRQLLNYVFYEEEEQDDDFVEKVADPSLCTSSNMVIVYSSEGDRSNYKGWKGIKVGTFTGSAQMSDENQLYHFFGPVASGESFSKDFDLAQKKPKGKMTVKKVRPVRRVSIRFLLRAFDIPDKYTNKIMDDEPLLIFVNGIKFDFNAMMDAPGTEKVILSKDEHYFEGEFAGISWVVSDGFASKNIGYGPQKDRTYSVSLNLPSIIFSNHDKISVQFMIKPEAKAKFYGFDHLSVDAGIADCEITGLETSPFDEFKKVMEIRLREQLGIGLLDKFQSQMGHCLENKIPKVDVHLVEKEKWKDANPRCSTAK